eukprot:EG_transcript_1624
MPSAPAPANEAARLDALRQALVLDTPPEPQYDILAELATLVTKAPSAFIVLVDQHRAWVKARVGVETAEVPRADSLCAHVVHRGEPVLTLDAAEDPRFFDVPLVTGPPHVRFYAGCPLLVPGTDLCLGALCVLDTRAWAALDDAAFLALRLLAQQAAQLLHLNGMLAHERRTLSNFVAKVSHELRTPLHGVLGCADVLRHQLEGAREAQYTLEAIESSAMHGMHVVNGILDFARLRAGGLALEPRPVSLRQCVEAPLRGLRADPATQRLDVGYELDEDLEMEVDGKRLQQVLANLLSNAVRFTQEGSVRVAVSSRPVKDCPARRTVRFEVRDTGLGIAPAQLAALFQPFRQGDDSPTRAHGGCGLGLAVCRGVCEALGGRIWLESGEGRGSTFCFTIEVPARTVPETLSPGVAGRSVLVVDPDPASPLLAHCRALGLEVSHSPTLVAAQAVLHQIGSAPAPLLLYASSGRQEPKIAAPPGPWAAIGTTPAKAPRGWPPPAFTLSRPVLYSDLQQQLRRLWRAEPPNASLVPRATASSLRVAVVDDNPVNCAVLRGFLKRLGCQIDLYCNGQEVVASAEGDMYDIVLMDLEMPVMDGFEATRLLRRTRRAKYVVAVTANGSPDVRRQCLAVGMDEFLEKPVRFQDVERVLQNFSRSASPSRLPDLALRMPRGCSPADGLREVGHKALPSFSSADDLLSRTPPRPHRFPSPATVPPGGAEEPFLPAVRRGGATYRRFTIRSLSLCSRES